MSIPQETSVLVIGGGPAGSYAAAALAREDISVVLLEADIFPRYHIGESMLPSIRHFLRFIDLDEQFDKYGFTKKVGAAFKLNAKRTAYTDFVAAGGPNNYGWNVIRSEADEMMFRHAGKQGAQIFDGVKVTGVEFAPLEEQITMSDTAAQVPGRPVSATWSRKDGSTGSIKFEYVIDASGRQGLVSTKYLKTRKYNQGLKNIAYWGYYKGAGQYAKGTERENVPFFQALLDTSGWVWSIPLHNGTMSVGIVINQELATAKKKSMGSPSSKEFFLESLKLVPEITDILGDAELVSDIKAASDWSYNASSYASPYVRIAGDAGCFIDPFFSSGVHLALAGALSAAMTICAVKRGDCDEKTGLEWHSKKVSEGYTRFLLVVLSAMKQIRETDEPVLSDFDEDGFERAFAFFRPIIQGTTDVNGKLTQAEVSKTLDFCLNAFQHTDEEKRDAVMAKLESADAQGKGKGKGQFEAGFSEEEERIMKSIRARQMLRTEDILHIENFSAETIDGLAPRLQRHALGLEKAKLPTEMEETKMEPEQTPVPIEAH